MASRQSSRGNRRNQSTRDSSLYGENRFQGNFHSLYNGPEPEEEEYTRGSRKKRKSRTASSAKTSRNRNTSNDYARNRRQNDEERYGYGSSYSDGYSRSDRDDYDSFYEQEPRQERRENTARKKSNSRIDLSGLKGMGFSGGLGKRTGAFLRRANGDAEKQRRFTLPDRNESNFTLLASVVLLLVIGLIMVTSSSYYYAYNTMDDSMYYFRRQVIWSLVGVVTMIIISRMPLKWIRALAFPIYLFSIFCSILVFFFGTSANGSTRWLGVGSLSFQPAELSKLAVAIYVSKLVDDLQGHMKEFRSFVVLMIAIAIPTALVGYQNLSSGIIVAAIGVIIMFVGGAKISTFLKIGLPVVGFVVLLLILPLLIDTSNMNGPLGQFLSDFAYRTDRISAWLDPFSDAMGDGYQTVQALYAVGSGGFFGRGLGQSIQKLGYIPFAYNDIIFAVICEELGLFGAIVVSALFAVFTWNGVKISLSAPNTYTSLLSIGLTGQIALQAVLNIAVNTNSIPATGISLPFISYGGSSMLFLMASVGLILNISTYGAAERKKAAEAVAGKEAY